MNIIIKEINAPKAGMEMAAIMCLERYLNKFLITYAHYECATSDFGSHLKSF